MQLFWMCPSANAGRISCRDSLKMSPCNSIEMSPSRVSCRKAGRPDGDDRDEQQGTAKDVIDDTRDGGITTTATGGRDAEGVIPAGEAHLASLPARRRQGF